ncbi:hypothetical protein HK098_000477 [Nowakowskiella sp. JEL0407]|nr:hypothetical protein HK098_000477 [Nowakowskiella sp. JEL0407]
MTDKLLLKIDGTTYDLTTYQHTHPGGSQILLQLNNKNATSEFFSVNHSDAARELMSQFAVQNTESHREDIEALNSVVSPLIASQSSQPSKHNLPDSDPTKTKTLHEYLNSLHLNILFYISTSLLAALALALSSQTFSLVSSLLLASPKQGQAGLGRFVITGKLPDVNFIYPWRLLSPSLVGTVTAWVGFVIHIVGQFFWIYAAGKAKERGEVGWGSEGNLYSRGMTRWNFFWGLVRVIQTQCFYEGLAGTVPEVTAQASVVMILILVLAMEIPRRGLFFGYHPCESSAAHLTGFAYMFLLIWQSSLLYHTSHRNRNWTIILETGVWIHGTITALFQSTSALLMFSTGFGFIFVVTQVWGVPIVQRVLRKGGVVSVVLKAFVGVGYVAAVVGAYAVTGNLRRAFSVVFIPVAEYLLILPYYFWFLLTGWVVFKVESGWWEQGETFSLVRLKTVRGKILLVVMAFMINLAVLLSFAVFFSAPITPPPVVESTTGV